jgi:hypothetical protein
MYPDELWLEAFESSHREARWGILDRSGMVHRVMRGEYLPVGLVPWRMEL